MLNAQQVTTIYLKQVRQIFKQLIKVIDSLKLINAMLKNSNIRIFRS